MFTSKTFFKLDFEALIKELFISLTVKFLFELNTNSTNETLGVGTRIEIPSTLPFNSTYSSNLF